MCNCCTIRIKNKDSVVGIYCNTKGDVKDAGVILQRFYNTPEKVLSLIKLGDIESLGDNLESCVAYHRDKDEELKNTNAYTHTIYTYIENKGIWCVHYPEVDTTYSIQELNISIDDIYNHQYLLDEIIDVINDDDIIEKCINAAKIARHLQPINLKR